MPPPHFKQANGPRRVIPWTPGSSSGGVPAPAGCRRMCASDCSSRTRQPTCVFECSSQGRSPLSYAGLVVSW